MIFNQEILPNNHNEWYDNDKIETEQKQWRFKNTEWKSKGWCESASLPRSYLRSNSPHPKMIPRTSLKNSQNFPHYCNYKFHVPCIFLSTDFRFYPFFHTRGWLEVLGRIFFKYDGFILLIYILVLWYIYSQAWLRTSLFWCFLCEMCPPCVLSVS